MTRLAALVLIAASTAQTGEFPAPGLKQPAEILIDRWGVPHIYARSFDDAFYARASTPHATAYSRSTSGAAAASASSPKSRPQYVEQDRAARLFLYRGPMGREWASYGPLQNRWPKPSPPASTPGSPTSPPPPPNSSPSNSASSAINPPPGTPPTSSASAAMASPATSTPKPPAPASSASPASKTAPARPLPLRPPTPLGIQIPDGLDPCLPPDVLGRLHPRHPGRPLHSLRPSPAPAAATTGPSPPAKSATGRPILASDPHRAYSTPSLRYIAHISAPGLDLIGGGEPSLPGVSIGHNGAIAFGLTRFYIDQEDLYFYELNPKNPLQYRYRGAWEDMRVTARPSP
jgi:penicillin G amidase